MQSSFALVFLMSILAGYAQAAAAAAAAAGVTGAAEGFASSVTGGGSAAPVYPTTNDELVSYLGDDSPRVIVLAQTFDFRGTEGSATSPGCAPWGTGSGCQTAIDQNGWCENDEPSAPAITVTYDKAATLGITVGSNKSIVGQGSSGVIMGKGLRIVNGASNVIVQNIMITDLNPQYVWGGDAITLDDTDLVWIDHVTTSLIGRQHIVLGTSASNRVTISNNLIDGRTNWSATCDGYHYWNLYFTGSNDLVTFKGNYVLHTSGRAPKVGGNTLLHVVNNYFYQSSGHLFEVDAGSNILVEGNVFQNAGDMVETDSLAGELFTSPDSDTDEDCTAFLGHACELNAYGSTTVYTGTDESFFPDFSGKSIASASPASGVEASVSTGAGYGKI
ncbi:polysaccharide lyase family 1 protein [Xylaria sp. CBS 124048]|nr:polysaccharide lyase family 1 protein [Xylaria sp. CBS 124048]